MRNCSVCNAPRPFETADEEREGQGGLCILCIQAENLGERIDASEYAYCER